MFRVISCVLTSIVLLLVVSVAAQAAWRVDGSIFSDDFPGTALGAGYNEDMFYGNTTRTIHDSLLDIDDPAAGDGAGYLTTDPLTFPDPDVWAVEVRFQVPLGTTMVTPTAGSTMYELISVQKAAWGPTGGFMGIRQDNTGSTGTTYDLIYGLFTPTIIATLNKGQFYTIAAARQSDDMVDVYLDGLLLGDMLAEQPTEIPNFILFGDGNGAELSGHLQIDFVRVGVWGDFAVPGDLDGDDYVDEDDVDLLTLNWGSAAHPAYDLDGNGLIGLGDAAIIRANWDPDPGVAGSVPEPGSLALLTIGSLALLVLRRRCRI